MGGGVGGRGEKSSTKLVGLGGSGDSLGGLSVGSRDVDVIACAYLVDGSLGGIGGGGDGETESSHVAGHSSDTVGWNVADVAPSGVTTDADLVVLVGQMLSVCSNCGGGWEVEALDGSSV